jgi:hypothetical protein
LGAAFVGVEDQLVGGDCEGDGEGSEDVEGGLVGAGLVAAQLGDVDADGVGEGLLGQAASWSGAGSDKLLPSERSRKGDLHHHR